MDGFERRREQKKEAILNAALELFKEYGYSKVSMAEIANRASVSQVSIYNFFISKENLKKELSIRMLDNLYTSTLNILESTLPIKEKIEKCILNRINIHKNFPMKILLESIKDSSNNNELAFEEKLESLQQVFSKVLDQARQEKIIREDVSNKAILSYIDIFQFYIANNIKAAAQYDSNPELFDEVIKLFYSGIIKNSDN